MNERKMQTFIKPANDASKDDMRKRKVLRAFIDRSGFKSLNIRNKVKLLSSWLLYTNSNMLISTTRKSRIFQPSLKYAFLCMTKPWAVIRNRNSVMKIVAKTVDETSTILSFWLFWRFWSMRFSLLSIPMKIEFTRIVRIMNHLKKSQLTSQTTALRI